MVDSRSAAFRLMVVSTLLSFCSPWVTCVEFSALGQSWAEGSLFFASKDDDGILDEGIRHGIPFAREHVRDALGLAQHEVDAVVQLVEKELGGHARRVSTLHDWMHVRIPWKNKDHMVEGSVADARSSPFLQRSLSSLAARGTHVERDMLHRVASALQAAELEHLVSHMMIASAVTEDVLATSQSHGDMRLPGRSLQQNGNDTSQNAPNVYVLDSGKYYEIFTENESEAVKNLGMWGNSPVMLLQCEGKEAPYLVGANTPSCLLGLDVTLQPVLGIPGTDSANPLTLRFDGIDQFGKTCAQVPQVCDKLSGPVALTEDTYVYGLPLYKYTVPNALYSGSLFVSVNTTQGIALIKNELSPYTVYNYYNASAMTIRDLYGVDPDLQGSSETVQSSVMAIGNVDSAVNETAINEYLDLLGLEPHSQLLISEFGVPNNVTVCIGNSFCDETMLDMQALQSFAPNATTYFSPSSKGKSPEQVVQLLMEFLDDLLTADPQSQVASLSWTWNYVKTAQLPIESLEGYLKKLAAMGKTILVASGDAGASGTSDGCNTIESPLAANQIAYSWPAASPWVTSVGGTQLLAMGETMETQEVACSSSTNGGVTSAGGFSGMWLGTTTPIWQQPFVKKYLEENNATTFSGFPTLDTPGYNPKGRGFPDIAAYAAYIPILDPSGALIQVSGTSLAAPVTASLFTLANQKLLSDGYDTIGYANLMLYWMAEKCPEAFTDITVGNNQAGEDGDLCLYGYPAAVGWDPVTGLGSINFGPFVTCAKQYQDTQRSTSGV